MYQNENQQLRGKGFIIKKKDHVTEKLEKNQEKHNDAVPSNHEKNKETQLYETKIEKQE